MRLRNFSFPSAIRNQTSTPTIKRRTKSEAEYGSDSRRQPSKVPSDCGCPQLIVLAHSLKDKLRPVLPGQTSQTTESGNGPDVLLLFQEGIDVRDFAVDAKQEEKKQEHEYLARMRAELEAQRIEVRDFAAEAETKKLNTAREELKRIWDELMENLVEVRDFGEVASGVRWSKGSEFA